MHYLDELPLKWSRPETRELRDFLAANYFRDGTVARLVTEAGISPATISWSQPMLGVWHDVLDAARKANRLYALLDAVRATGDSAVVARLDEIGAAEPLTSANAADGSVKWRGFDDEVELERQIFDEPTLMDVAFLQRGAELSPAIVRLAVRTRSGQRVAGTGFHIGEGALLTNHHVLHAPKSEGSLPAQSVEAWFSYELSTDGTLREHCALPCRSDSIVGDPVHDWAVVQLAGSVPAGTPTITLDAAREVNVDDRVYIIGHPLGGVKKIGMHHNLVRYVDSDVVQYWTDTERGSSGSPVFDSSWNVVALHHKSVPAPNDDGRAYRNQGRAIRRVIQGLYAAGRP